LYCAGAKKVAETKIRIEDIFTRNRMVKKNNCKRNIWNTLLVFIQVYSITCLINLKANAQPDATVQLSWLGDKAPGISAGVSWGVPFSEGQIQPDSDYVLKDAKGNALPVQSWPLAYWPDGSLKWAGLSTVVEAESGQTFQLQAVKRNTSDQNTQSIKVTESQETIVINTGVLECEIPRQGGKIINYIKIDGQQSSSGGELVCIVQDGAANEFGAQPAKEKYIGNIEQVTLEQSGPVRSVVKIEGTHTTASGDRSFLPFVVRLYFYAGQQTVKMIHTIIYDGDQNKDFIRGLGVVFHVPMDEEPYNRHVRFSDEK
jgi:hypothetical protein